MITPKLIAQHNRPTRQCRLASLDAPCRPTREQGRGVDHLPSPPQFKWSRGAAGIGCCYRKQVYQDPRRL